MSSTERATVFIDADNTLWDTNAVFADAQLGLLADVEGAIGVATGGKSDLAFVRSVDQAIASRHHAGLRYPVALLIRGLELSLGGLPAEAAARAAWSGGRNFQIDEQISKKIEQRYFDQLSAQPAIRNGVMEGLEGLRAQNALLFVVTEGAKTKVEATAERLGLAGYFERVIAAPKTPDLYRRVLRLAGTPQMAFMVGDQLDRDIGPAKSAGLRTIYFPGGFQPKWLPGVSEVNPDHIISSFAEVADIIEHEPRRSGSLMDGATKPD